jgi:chaperonin GroEL (HSP60 family)
VYFGIYFFGSVTIEVCGMYKPGIWEPYVVKTQTLKTVFESARLILLIDAAGLRPNCTRCANGGLGVVG